MKRPHGTYVAYVVDRCRCDDCRRANREYERERAQRLEPAYVSAGPAREHIAMLAEHGIGLNTVAKVSGVAHGTLSKLVYGDYTRRMVPSKRVRKTTQDRIMAVMPSDIADGGRVPAARTWALIDEMVTAGVPKARIAEALRTGPALQLSPATVTARNARLVAEFHAAWHSGQITIRRRSRHGNGQTAHPPAPLPVPREIDPADRQRRQAEISDLYLELAEIVELRNAQPWRAQAACRNRPTYLWFPARGDRATLDKAKRICAACTVRDRCRTEAPDDRAGVYGGLSAKARRDLRRPDREAA